MKSSRCHICGGKWAVSRLSVSEGRVLLETVCPDCIEREKGVETRVVVPASELLSVQSSPGSLSCPVCGISYRSFRRAGILGCPSCYDAFSAGISAVMLNRRSPGGRAGRGHRLTAADRKLLLRNLNEAVKMAVANEDYRSAAILRNRRRE